MSSQPNDDYLDRVKAEIRADADLARTREPLPRRPPPPVRHAGPCDDGIERDRLDYGIGELTGPHYRAFIDHAFRALLKRAPDDASADRQIRLLAGGAGKAEILGNLRWSPEGRRVGTRVRGLLPRYALAKLTRVPVLGYFVEWGIALAGLPMLLRHQRAADTSMAARFGDIADAQRDHAQRLAELGAEHDRRSEAIRADIQRALSRLDDLERRAATAEGRLDATTHEMIALRHHVHTVNHWVASVQGSLEDLEDAQREARARADAFAAAVAETPQQAAARAARHTLWAGELAAGLPPAAQLLDLGSGDGAWLEALRALAIDAGGVEANEALAVLAQQRGQPVAAGEPLAALARCADVALDAITFAHDLLQADAGAAGDVLAQCMRVLRPAGCLLLRIEPVPYRLAIAGAFDADAYARAAGLLAAAGFGAARPLAAAGGCALLARRPSP